MYPSVSLVLSSGGARGVAHIGVIEELERQGFEIKSIAGSSMGALVGGIYASGNLQVYKDWMCNLDKKAVFNMVDFTLSANGLVKGNKVIKELKKIVPDENIENLPISFTAVATDIKNKKEVVFQKGSLFDAIRASISIPTVFKPYKLDGMILIDGGVVNPLPINRVKRRKDDIIIAVDVSAPYSTINESSEELSLKPENSELSYFSFLMKKGFMFLPKVIDNQLNYYTLLSQCGSLMLQQISAMTVEMYPPDILIQIPINSYGPYHFYKSEEIIEAGAIATRKALTKY
ncbi:MAG: patatin-like phospholipase family protein [Prolixibacteraceae bacterium]|nr:patatin-like phospholipase family protein [Prolixibacteraceae bacterium]